MEIIDGIYINCGGKNALYTKITGNRLPAVVIETAWGGLSTEWMYIQMKLSQYCTVISYDRAGYAESSPSKSPRNSENITNELKNILDNSGIPAPFIFIAHSAGGLYVQHFARKFPDYVGGVVFVDSYSTNLEKFNQLNATNYQQNISLPARMAGLRLYSEMEEAHFKSLINPLLENIYRDMNPQLADQLKVYQSEQQLYKSIVAEYNDTLEGLSDIDSSAPFPDIPLKVIHRDRNVMNELSQALRVPIDESNMVEDLWLSETQYLTSLSNQSEKIPAFGADHNIHFSNPDIIIDSVMSIWNNFGSYIEIG